MGITPAKVIMTFWTWFWIGVGTLVLIGGLTIGAWQAGWWFTSHNATRQAQTTQDGYSNQTTLRAQITSNYATLASLDTQITQAAGDPGLITNLKIERDSTGNTICSDAAQITGTPLPAQQAQWVTGNCALGVLSTNSPDYSDVQP